MTLPPLPKTSLVVLEERPASPDDESAFMRIRRIEMRAAFPDGTASEPFEYCVAHRERLDAVVIAPHFRAADGERHVFLRSAVRPPVALRPVAARPVPEKDTLGSLWELPAGLVEIDERSPEGLRRCAARELFEEVGLEVAPDRMMPLGPPSFPAPGMIGERHFFFHVEVDPGARITPPEDGSPLERHASIASIALEEALALVRAGAIEDAKTEIALRRLAEV